MYTYPALSGANLEKYHRHIESDHDYEVSVDVMTLEQEVISTAVLLDGQVNIDQSGDGPDRTGSIVLSDPAGALNYGTSFARDSQNKLWMARLIQINHSTYVPELGFTVSTIPLIGNPTAAQRKGAEISLELSDKSVLADNGVRPRTYKKGLNVRNVLVDIIRSTGERYYRIPATTKKLTAPYTMGMGDNALTPWQLFRRIAGTEMGWRAFYSIDGFATCEPTATARLAYSPKKLLSLPDSSTSFTDLVNYAKVSTTRQTVYQALATLDPSHELSEQSLGRNGALRTLPKVVASDSSIVNNMTVVKKRAAQEVKSGSGLDYGQSYEIIPVFHLDNPDKITLPEAIGAVGLNKASIPLGTGGNMTLGHTRWVSQPVTVKSSRVRGVKYKRRKKGG